MDPAAGALVPVVGALAGGRRLSLAASCRWFAADLVPLLGLTAVSAVGTAASPVLAGHPLVLVALAPRLPFLVLAAGRCALLPLLLVATIRLCVADPFHFRLGRRVAEAPRGRTRAWVSNLSAGRARSHLPLVAIALRPVGRHLAWAGAAQANRLVVGLLDVGSTAVYVIAVTTAGHAVFG